MHTYSSDKIRNIAILGHSGAGKTNLTEALRFTAKVLNRITKPTDESRFTSSLKFFSIEYEEIKYNFLDTPGYFDFEAEVVSTLAAASGSVIVVDATADLQVGTDKALEMTDALGRARFIFVNKIDSEKEDFNRILEQLRERYGKKIAPFQIPWGSGESFRGFINVVERFGREYNGKECVTVPMPKDMEALCEPVREMLMESVAESDERLLEKFFSGENFTQEEIQMGLRKGVLSGEIIPVLVGSTAKNIGIHTLLDMIKDFMPSPADEGEHSQGTFSGQVFKTVIDPFLGKLSYIRVHEGALKAEDEIYTLRTGKKEKIGRLYSTAGAELKEIQSVNAGDIVIAAKLTEAKTSDTLSSDPQKTPYPPLLFQPHQMLVAVEPENKNDEDKISQALDRLCEEDPSFIWKRDPQTKQTVLGVQGDIHVNALKEKLSDQFGVKTIFEEIKIPYQESIRGTADVQGKHKKQSGGHGQYADVKIRFEPSEQAFVFKEELFGGSVPRNYVPAVEKGLHDAMQRGVLAGFPVTRLQATLYDGSYHDVDSSEMAFKMAAQLAFKKGMEAARPILLEPLMKLSITVPEEFTGDVMGDLNKKRARVLGVEPAPRNRQTISALAPQAETVRYAVDLRALTQGRGHFEMEFEDYEEVPAPLAEKIISKQKNEGIQP